MYKLIVELKLYILMKNRVFTAMLLIIFASILSGCWSRKELNQLGIAAALGIDKIDGNYLLTAQVINVDEIGQERTGQRVPVVTYGATGRTLFEALRRITLKSPKKIYIAHVRVVIISEALAREGIGDILDFLSRDHEFRTDFYILIAKDTTAEEVLTTLTVATDIPADKIFSGLETSEGAWAATHAVHLDDLISNMTAKGISPVLTGILLIGNSRIGKNIENRTYTNHPALLKIGTLAAFKNGKLVGWLSEEESMGFNAIMGNIKSSVTTFTDSEGGMITVEVLRTKSTIKAYMVNGKPKIVAEIRGEGNVGEVHADIDLAKTETISEIEKLWSETVEKRMKKVVKTAQRDLESDILGFGEAIHRQQPKVWKKLKNDWDTEFKNLEVEVRAISKIKGLGTTTNPIKEE
jgi:spore germination protein KC